MGLESNRPIASIQPFASIQHFPAFLFASQCICKAVGAFCFVPLLRKILVGEFEEVYSHGSMKMFVLNAIGCFGFSQRRFHYSQPAPRAKCWIRSVCEPLPQFLQPVDRWSSFLNLECFKEDSFQLAAASSISSFVHDELIFLREFQLTSNSCESNYFSLNRSSFAYMSVQLIVLNSQDGCLS